MNNRGEGVSKIEQKHEEPNIDFLFLTETHQSDQRPEKLLACIKDADVVGLEYVGWTKDMQKAFDALAQGTATVESVTKKLGALHANLSYPRWQAIMRAVSEYHTRAVFVDVPEGPLATTIETRKRMRDTMLQDSFLAYLKGDFDTALETEKKMQQDFFETIQLREQQILKNIRYRIPDAVKKDPTLSQKDHVQALIAFGPQHTTVFHALRKEVSARLVAKSSYSSSSIEILRRMSHGKDVPQDVYAHSVLENFFSQMNSRSPIRILTNVSISDRLLVFRYLASQFSVDEIGELSRRIPLEGRDDVYGVIDVALRRKNLDVLTSPENMDTLLKSLKKRIKL